MVIMTSIIKNINNTKSIDIWHAEVQNLEHGLASGTISVVHKLDILSILDKMNRELLTRKTMLEKKLKVNPELKADVETQFSIIKSTQDTIQRIYQANLSPIEKLTPEILSKISAHLVPEDLGHLSCASKTMKLQMHNPYLEQIVSNNVLCENKAEYIFQKDITQSLKKGQFTCRIVKLDHLHFKMYEGKLYTINSNTPGFRLEIWDLNTRFLVNFIQLSSADIHYLQIENDKLYIVADKKIEIIDLKTNQISASIPFALSLIGSKIYRDNLYILDVNIVRIFDLNKQQLIKELKSNDSQSLVSIQVEQNWICVLSQTHIYVWDLKKGTTVALPVQNCRMLSLIKIINNTLYGLYYPETSDSLIRTWNLEETHTNLPILQFTSIGALAFASNKLYIREKYADFQVWDLKTHGIITKWQHPDFEPNKMEVVGDKMYVSNKKIMQIWNLRAPLLDTLRQIKELFSIGNLIIGLDRFEALPDTVKNAIYAELYSIQYFENDYWGCAEDAFLGEGEEIDSQQCTDAIQNYLNKLELAESNEN